MWIPCLSTQPVLGIWASVKRTTANSAAPSVHVQVSAGYLCSVLWGVLSRGRTAESCGFCRLSQVQNVLDGIKRFRRLVLCLLCGHAKNSALQSAGLCILLGSCVWYFWKEDNTLFIYLFLPCNDKITLWLETRFWERVIPSEHFVPLFPTLLFQIFNTWEVHCEKCMNVLPNSFCCDW